MKRDAVLQVRVTQEEKELAELLAEEFAMKVSDYARACILVGPTPSAEEVENGSLVTDAKDPVLQNPENLAVPGDATRDDYVRYLYERITELHRDVEKRWPGSKARRQAGAEWAKVKRGEPLEAIPQREGYAPIPPTAYRTA